MSVRGYRLFETAIGDCAIAWEAGRVSGTSLPADAGREATAHRMRRHFPGFDEQAGPEWVERVIQRIQQLLREGHDDLADVPLDLDVVGEFNRRVYEFARRVPPGRTVTYGEIARALGEPGASRAVGQALGQNPFAPIVPCHRVLAAGAQSGGFSAGGGVATKLRMLQTEKARFTEEPGLFDEPF